MIKRIWLQRLIIKLSLNTLSRLLIKLEGRTIIFVCLYVNLFSKVGILANPEQIENRKLHSRLGLNEFVH